MRFLHFSDFHLRPNTLGERSIDVLKNMLKCLEQLHAEEKIDLIIFSGDLIDKGAGDFEGLSLYEALKIFEERVITLIVNTLHLDYSQFLFVPGNHDVDRGRLTKDEHKEILTSLKTEADVDRLLHSGSANHSRIEDFVKFQREYYEKHGSEGVFVSLSTNEDLQSSIVYPIDGYKVGISLLNSSWLCYDNNDVNNIWLGTCQLTRSLSFLREYSTDFNIAVSHHHFDFLKETERKDISEILHRNYSIFFSGHTHGQNTSYVRDAKGSIIQSIAAGNLYNSIHEEDPNYKNGFTILDYDVEDRRMFVTPYFQQTDESFDVDIRYGNMGTDMLEEPGQQIFQSLDRWICSYEKQYAPVENAELLSKRDDLKNPAYKKILLAALSGLGKTRLIYDTFNDGVQHPLSFYADLQSQNADALCKAFSEVLMQIGNSEGMIIVDNCEKDIAYNLFLKCPSNVRLICCNNQVYDLTSIPNVRLVDITRNTLAVEVNRLIEEQLPLDEQNSHICEEIKKIADGFPYMAYVLLDTYHNQGEVKITSAKALAEKLIRYQEADQKTAMKTISVFQPFPTAIGNKSAREFILSNNTLTPLYGKELSERKRIFNSTINRFTPELIDKTNAWLNVRPFPLAVFLASEWFVELEEEDVETLLNDFDVLRAQNPALHRFLSEGMARRIEYMKDMPLAVDFVDRLMGNITGAITAPFANEKVVCSDMGSRLFLAMSSVNPCAVSKCLFGLISVKTTEWLKEYCVDGARRNLVWALEKLCFNASTFEESAYILAKLCLAENESWANNASGQFKQLFHIFLAGTEANLMARLNVIKRLYEEGGEMLPLAMDAIDNAFVSRGFVRSGGAERFGSEEKKDYIPLNKEVWDYWYGCRDILLTCFDNGANLCLKTLSIIESHASSWLMDGYYDTIFKPLVSRANVQNLNLSKMFENIGRMRGVGLMARYSIEKKTEIEDFLSSIKPNTFDVYLKEQQQKIYDNSLNVNKDYFRFGLEIMESVATEFLERQIYLNKKEINLLLKDDFYIDHCFFLKLEEQIKEDQLTCLFKGLLELLKEKPVDKLSPFIGSICYVCRNRQSCKWFIRKLYNEGYHSLYVLLLTKCETTELDSIQELILKDKAGCFENDMLPLYLKNVSNISPDSLLRLISILEDNYPHRIKEIVGVVLRLRFLHDDGDSVALKNKIKSLLLQYPICNDNPGLNYDYTRYVISILERGDEVDFARSMFEKIVEGFNHEYLCGNFEGLVSVLLTKYTDVVWSRFAEVFNSSDYSAFWLQVHNEIGSGFGFGAGPMFQVGNDRIKAMCEMYPEESPIRIAEMMPIYDNSLDNSDSFGELVLWLLDKYGTNKQVLAGIHANINSYSWTGSTIGLLSKHKSCFEKLLSHKISQVRGWAASCIQEMDYQIQKEKDQEDYMRMHYN